MHDIVIRGGLVYDGSGDAPRRADVAIDGERIAAVGTVAGKGIEEIDAARLIVTPGFVDLHSHYDAQALWDPILAPSSWHGVTTVVIGNCSVGFAPARAADRPFLLDVMEAVEEIPPRVIEAGVDWDWETFPEYLDALERRRHTIDIGTQIPHVALRAYVMGDRAVHDEPATPEDIEAMGALTEEALRAGALALSCSRTPAHRMADRRVVPGSDADGDEVMAIAAAVGRVGDRVVQYLGNAADLDHDLPYILDLARGAMAPIHFIMSDTRWRDRLATIEQAAGEGLTLVGHVAPRAVGLLTHWEAVEHPFSAMPTVVALAGKTPEERAAAVRDPAVKAAILAEAAEQGLPPRFTLGRMFEMAATPDYEPDPATDSIAARAAVLGVDPVEHLYDALTGSDGAGMVYVPIANYRAGDFSEVRQIMAHDGVVVSLADGGAHCTRVCDAGASTFMLAHWARDRVRGEKLPIERVVRQLTSDTAAAYGLHDRGRIAPGYLADLNVIDFDRLTMGRPYRAWDFPADGLRLLQKPAGYVATVKRGQVIFRDGEHCGVFPGAVIRGPQAGAGEQVSATEMAA